MTDCSAVEIRDRLPEAAAGTLVGGDAAAVESHLRGCAVCRAELALIDAVARSLAARTPRVDTATIVLALPPGLAAAPRARWTSPAWRMAAALVVAAAGLGGLALVDRAATPSAPSGSNTTALSSPDPASAGTDLAGIDTLTDTLPIVVADAAADSQPAMVLSSEELSALVAEIEQIEALPLEQPRRRQTGLADLLPAAVLDSLIGAGSGGGAER
jgi:hypothetical protein